MNEEETPRALSKENFAPFDSAAQKINSLIIFGKKSK